MLEGRAPFQREQVPNPTDRPCLVGDRCLIPRFLCKSQLVTQVIKKLSMCRTGLSFSPALSVPHLYSYCVHYIKL